MLSQNHLRDQLDAEASAKATREADPIVNRDAAPSGQTDAAPRGYFEPGSVSQQLFADPSSKLGGVAGILLQSLNPMMMRLFSGTSDYASDVAGRGERTGRYIDTVVFGDREHADAAAEAVRRLHARAVWVDPRTGEELRADTEEWLAWTHNSLMFGVLRAAEAFGPRLTGEDQDRFLREQRVAARLMGVEDDVLLPGTRAELDAYISENRDWMALTLPAAEVTRGMRKPSLRGNPVSVLLGLSVQDGILSLLPDWALLLFGIEGRPMSMRAATRTTRRIIASARRRKTGNELIAEVVDRVSIHPYRRVRRS